uniref:tetratricopeptide repeat protein n=1 Tax=Flavobacterium sp. TaxID=239 RepID=UPI004049F344
MATYNKRGYKAPKPKEEAVEDDFKDVDVQDSTTAEVFSTLDDGASKAEEWVARNQKYIFGIVGAVALLTVGYLVYDRFMIEPKQDEAANEMFLAQENFQKALDATTGKDSLFNVALSGADSKYGFLQIIENYSGTDAANLSHYYAGIAYLNIGDNTNAIKYLADFKADDINLSVLAKGAIGDAFAQKNQPKEALEYYEMAVNMSDNEMTSPRFLYKAGQTALQLEDKAKALTYFNKLKDNYATAPEARNVDGLIGMAQ